MTGDLSKSVLFIVQKYPIQFVLIGIFQSIIDIGIMIGIVYYKRNNSNNNWFFYKISYI